MYLVMRHRKRKMALQQAIAEGKVSIKSYDENAVEDDQGDGSYEMEDMSPNVRYADSARPREETAEFRERFGSVHMNETALEYFQSTNVAGKSADQMIREFRAIQRYKEEELVQ